MYREREIIGGLLHQDWHVYEFRLAVGNKPVKTDVNRIQVCWPVPINDSLHGAGLTPPRNWTYRTRAMFVT